MSAFDDHKISHLSASSVNLFAAQPALWVAEKLLNRKSPVGAAAHRGAAVEAGVTKGLLKPEIDVEECVSEAESVFRQLMALSGDPRRETEAAAVGPIVRMALPELRSYGHDVVCQERIEWRAPGLSVPFIGFIDYRWPYHQILVDLKTQLRLNGEIKVSHARQVASYAGQMGPSIDARVTYCTPKKVATYKVENVQQHIDALIRIGQTIERFLGVSKDPYELAGLLVPDPDSFYFADPATRQMAWDVWKI